MFSEILKIKPQLDNASLNTMSNKLNGRFASVAKKFGKGLEHVLKGNILFLSAGFLASLLNPLDKVEERIKKLLGESTDVTDLAEKFGTDPATLKRIQSVGEALGLSPEKFTELLTKYGDAVDTARKELEDPTKERSATTIAVQKFVDEEDVGIGFMKFLQSLVARGEGPSEDVFFSDRENRLAAERAKRGETLSPEDRARLKAEGLLKERSGREVRSAIEELVFGEALSGAAKRLAEQDIGQGAAELGIPFVKPGPDVSMEVGGVKYESPNDPLASAIDKNFFLDSVRRVQETKNEVQDYLASSALINKSIVQNMEAAAERGREADRAQLAQAESLQRAAQGIDEIKKLLVGVQEQAVKFMGWLGQYVPLLIQGIQGLKDVLFQIKESRFFRMGGG